MTGLSQETYSVFQLIGFLSLIIHNIIMFWLLNYKLRAMIRSKSPRIDLTFEGILFGSLQSLFQDNSLCLANLIWLLAITEVS